MPKRVPSNVPLGRKTLGRTLEQESLAFWFQIASDVVSAHYDAAFKRHRLGVTDYALLLALGAWKGGKPLTVSHLAGRLHLDRTTATKSLQRLSGAGYVSIRKIPRDRDRVAKPDARFREVRLTNAGDRIVKGTNERLQRAQRDMVDVLTMPVLRVVFGAIHLLIRNLPAQTQAWKDAGGNPPETRGRSGGPPVAPKDRRCRPFRPVAGHHRSISAVSRRRLRARLTR